MFEKIAMNKLVNLQKFAPEIALDVRYARSDNFLHRPVYTLPLVFLQIEAAIALKNAHAALQKDGFGLVVFDGYRPWSVTKIFWDSVEPEQRRFFANPEKGSAHNRGMAVDLSLFYLETGKQAEMPSDFDEMSERSYANFSGATELERRNRSLLKEAMESAGFKGIEFEWWHFNFGQPEAYPILNLSFEELLLLNQ